MRRTGPDLSRRLRILGLLAAGVAVAACEGTPVEPVDVGGNEGPPPPSVMDAVPAADDVLDRVIPSLTASEESVSLLRLRITALRETARRGDARRVSADVLAARGALDRMAKYEPLAEPHELSVIEILIDDVARLAGAPQP